jgi:hypothetical protein
MLNMTRKTAIAVLALIVMIGFAATSYAMMGSVGNQGTLPGGMGTMPGTGYMGMPTGQEMFSYGPMQGPVVGADPASSGPLGVGTVATGGNMLSIHATTGQFTGPMDVYFMLYAPSVDPLNIYVMHQDGTFQPATMGVLPWQAGVTGVDQSILGNIPTSMIPQGTYTIGLMTVPSGSNMSTYYLWMTNFTIQ